MRRESLVSGLWSILREKKKRYYFHNPHKSFPAVLSSEGNSFDLLINVETAALPISPELLIWPPINRPRAALSDLLFLLEFFFHILKLCAASQTLSKKKKKISGCYLSDLLAGSLVRLQLVQNPLGVLQHDVDLLPHLSLGICGLGICGRRTEEPIRNKSSASDQD